MRVPQRLTVALAEPSQAGGELASGRLVDALEEPEVARRREQQRLVIGQADRPIAKRDVDGQVLIDHQHAAPTRGSDDVGIVRIGVTTEERVSSEVGVESSLERISQIAAGDSTKDLSAFGGDARVAGAASHAALLEKVLTSGAHGVHCASDGHATHAVLPERWRRVGPLDTGQTWSGNDVQSTAVAEERGSLSVQPPGYAADDNVGNAVPIERLGHPAEVERWIGLGLSRHRGTRPARPSPARRRR